MAIVQGFTNSFKRQLFEGKHDFRTAGHTFKMALYTSSASLGASTTDYTTSNEATGVGYTAGGIDLTSVDPTLSSSTALIDFADAVWAGITVTARGALIYNSTTEGGSGTTDAVMVLDFGSDKIASSATFTVQFPPPDALNAIIRIE